MRILIVTPDLKIVAFTGLLGWFYKIYQQILSFQLKLLVKKFPGAQILTTKSLQNIKNSNTFYFDDLFLDLDYNLMRKKVWKFIRNYYQNDFFWKGISVNKVTETRSAIHFSLGVFPYIEVVEDLISKFKPEKIYTITRDSISEKVAKKIADEKNIQIKTLFSPNISKIEKLGDSFLRQREARIRFNELVKLSKKKKQIKKTPKNGILIEASHSLQLKSAVPLLLKLSNSFLVTQVANTELELEKFGSKNLNWFTTTSVLTGEEIGKIYSDSQIRAKKWWRKVEKESKNNFLFNLDRDYLKNTSLYYFPLAAIAVDVAKKILKRFAPKATIVFSDRGFIDSALGLVAKKFKTSSFLVSPNTNMSVDKTNNYDICDFVTVPGVHLKKELIKIGHSKDKIFVVGDLRFDNLPRILESFDRKNICKKIGIAPNKKIALLISFHLSGLISAEEKKALFQSTTIVVEKIKDVQLVIRPHPNEPLLELKSEVSEWGTKNAKIDSNSSLYELLFISDLVVMTWSMTGFEAMVFGKPVITVNFFGKNYDRYIPYVSQGAAVEATSRNNLEEAIKTLLFNHEERKKQIMAGKKFVEYYSGKIDGKVAERIISLILSKAKNIRGASLRGRSLARRPADIKERTLKR